MTSLAVVLIVISMIAADPPPVMPYGQPVCIQHELSAVLVRTDRSPDCRSRADADWSICETTITCPAPSPPMFCVNEYLRQQAARTTAAPREYKH
jgi:hypothetical protein